MASPVFDGAGACVAALSVSGPARRMKPEALADLGRRCAAAVRRSRRSRPGRLPTAHGSPAHHPAPHHPAQPKEAACGEYQFYIGGSGATAGRDRAAAISPASGETFARVAAADPADVDDAVVAAAAAGEDWAAVIAVRRAEWCDAVVAAGSAAVATSWPGR